jgi:dipeptidyl aminopeptidase/acylaminoacyl peptidase
MCARGRVIAEPRLSPDGSTVAFLASADGRARLVTVPAGGGPERVVTADPPPTPSAAYGGGAFDWVGGDRLVYADTDGRLQLVPVDGGPAVQVADRGPAAAPAASPDGTRVAWLVDSHHVAMATIGDWPTRLSTTADFCFDPAWSPDGRSVVWHEWEVPDMPWDSSRIVRDGEVVAGGGGVGVGQPRFSAQGRLAYLSDEGGWLNLHVDGAPLVKEEAEHGGPSWGPGQRCFAWSPDGTAIAFCRNEAGCGRLCLVDVATGAVRDVAKGVHGGLSWAGHRLVAVRSGATTPAQLVAYDTGSWDRVVLAHAEVAGFESAGLTEPEVVDWEADDGAVVHGRLYRPAAPPDGHEKPPMLVRIHGGPTGQQQVSFDPRIAYFVDRGWAVLVPDHRGSTGWGRAYTQAMAGRWGDLDVSDCAAGMRAAAQRGWCDPTRMVPIGGSAGGFTVLLLLARHPELCAAGVDLFGVADLLDLDETTHRFEQHYLHSVVGPLPGTADRYRDRSPVNVAAAITAPLLILQGDADKVVPPAQSQAIADAVRPRGGTAELHLYPGEGHGWQRAETLIDELERTESFLRRHVLRWR